MNERVIEVFYDNLAYPFKDKELTVRYPIVGGAFMGASNTTHIKFYIDNLGNPNATWVAIAKLPNGKKGSKVLSTTSDDKGDYALLELSSWFTQAKGDLFISLNGYQGGIDLSYNSETGLYEVDGTPIIEATGSVKINVAYATQIVGSDEVDEITLQSIYALFGTKLDTDKGIVVIDNTSANISGYEEGQMFYSKADQMLYKLVSGALVPQGIGIVKTNSVANGTILDKNKVALDMCFVIFNSTNVIYRKTGVESGLAHFVSELEFVDGNNSGNDTFGRSQFDVNLSSGAISNSELYSKDLYNKDQIDNQFYNKTQANDTFLKKAGDTATGEIIFNNVAPKTNATVNNDSPTTTLITKAYLIAYLQPHIEDYNTLNNVVDAIIGVMPSGVIPVGETLATQDFVNSSINSSAAFFRGNFDNYQTPQESGNTTLMGVAWQTQHKNQPYYVSNNDYAYVNDDETHDHEAWRYIYVEGTGWQPQFRVNEAPLTQAQLDALNSGITQALVQQIAQNQSDIATLQSKLPKMKDFTLSSTLWQYDSVNQYYYCEVDAGANFVFTDNDQKVYTAINESDLLIKDTYGINVTSNATTQKFKFICTRGTTAPTDTVNFTISVYGGY